MNLFKKTITTLAIVCVLGLAPNVFAASTMTELQLKISEARVAHAELKAEVQTGTLDIEEARNRWHVLIDELRAEKQELFDQRINNIKEKYEQYKERYPERAVVLEQRIEATVERREEMQEKRMKIQAQVQAGAITRQDALIMKRNYLESAKDHFQELKKSWKEDTMNRRGYIKIDDIKGEARETNFLEFGDVKGESNQDAQLRLQKGEVRPVGFDPTGIKALQAFPDIKADINAAVNIRNDKATPKPFEARRRDVDKASTQ